MKTFKKSLRKGRLALTAELALTHQSSATDILQQARCLDGLADAAQINDSPLAWVQPSAVSVSALLLQNGMDALPILTCRDRNRLGLHSDLLGLRALGVGSVLLTRGRRVGKKSALHGTTVFDLTGRELIAMANDLNDEEGLPVSQQLLVGTGARTFYPRPGWEPESLMERTERGAQFVQTQIVMNMDVLRHWMRCMVEARITWRCSVIVSVAAFPTAASARWVKENMTDSKLPLPLIERLEQAADPELEGIAICAEIMQQIAEIPGVSGINLVSTGDVVHSAAAISASGLAGS